MHAGIRDVFDALTASGYVVKCGRQQVMLYHGGDNVGGWNTRDGHWYVSKVIACGREALLRDHGFVWMERPRHQWWQLEGVASSSVFVEVVRALTEAP